MTKPKTSNFSTISQHFSALNTPVKSQIFTGKITHDYGFASAINKQPIGSRVYLSESGLEGDQCADLKHHGGSERALHQYPAEHYAFWADKYADHKNAWQAPGMGENISTLGMTEESVCIGDRYQWGEAIIEVSQPRSPCFKLNRRWNVEEFSVCMQDISRCGWLFRVFQTGYVDVDASLTLIARDNSALTVKQVCEMFFGDPLNKTGLQKLQKLNKLSQSWRDKVELRLATGKVENWNFRLSAKP